jgi:enoyl-CoA hydratase/isomerase-like protein
MTAVQVRRAGEVAEIVLSRPGKLNAMNMAWVTGLVDAVASLERDKPGIVVVRGEGRAFCAGLDLDMLATEGMPEGFYAQQEEAFVGLERLDRLIIAQIHAPAKACEELIALACEAFARWGDAEAGRRHLEFLRGVNIEANVRSEVLALRPGHPYLQLPLQMSIGLKPRLRSFVNTERLTQLNQQAENELHDPRRWGTTFTLIQSWGQFRHRDQ